jgi:hypothetical protein
MGGVSLPGPPNELLSFDTGRSAARFFPKALGFLD